LLSLIFYLKITKKGVNIAEKAERSGRLILGGSVGRREKSTSLAFPIVMPTDSSHGGKALLLCFNSTYHFLTDFFSNLSYLKLK